MAHDSEWQIFETFVVTKSSGNPRLTKFEELISNAEKLTKTLLLALQRFLTPRVKI
jgi:hypothetical protein